MFNAPHSAVIDKYLGNVPHRHEAEERKKEIKKRKQKTERKKEGKKFYNFFYLRYQKFKKKKTNTH